MSSSRARSPRPLRCGALVLTAAALSRPGPVAAAATQGALAVLPPAAGQQALAVRVEASGITARACATVAGCSPDGGKPIAVPPEAASSLGGARIATVTLEGGRRLAKIEAPRAAGGDAWAMLLAAPLAGSTSRAEPIVVWSGFIGAASNELGDARSEAIVEEPTGKGTRVLVGERREDVTICGRPTLVAAREVDPATMALVKGASVQNLPAEQRSAARKLIAERREAGSSEVDPAFRVLRPVAASSAVGKRFAEIADGDPKTSWSEARVGTGRGEFVSFSSPSEVPITGIGLTIKPLDDVPGGAAPRTLFLATPDRLFEVTVPEDAWQKDGARYEVKLPEAVATSCVALVLDQAYAPRGSGEPRVTIAEVAARTDYDAQSAPALVGALAGGGERARAAAALLARSGPVGVEAAIAGYAKLDPAGRQLAASVIDTAPCSAQIPFFTALLASASASASASGAAPRGSRPAAPDQPDPELHHARDRVRRCGRAAAPALAQVVREGRDAARLAAAQELALVAPAEAVPALLDAIGTAREATRRELRAALALAVRSDRALAAVEEELAPDRLRARPEVAQIDLLRALTPVLGRVKGGAGAFQRVASASSGASPASAAPGASPASAAPGASPTSASSGASPAGVAFRARYLLQAPAASLARAGDGAAEAFLRASLRKDADAHVRARAAEVAAAVPALAPDLLAAVAEPDVRVREAAIGSLARAAESGAPSPRGASEALAARLASDPWTFIRAGAARALGAVPATAAGDQALARALADGSPDVRGHALDALGAHRARAHIEAVRERAEDKAEEIEVRARATLALAAMCDATLLDLWTRLALRAKAPVDERDVRLGSAAVAALGIVHPADLQARLKPLFEKGTPLGLREMAKAALSTPGQCRR